MRDLHWMLFEKQKFTKDYLSSAAPEEIEEVTFIWLPSVARISDPRKNAERMITAKVEIPFWHFARQTRNTKLQRHPIAPMPIRVNAKGLNVSGGTIGSSIEAFEQESKVLFVRNLFALHQVKSNVRSVLALIAIALGGVAMAQVPLTDLECRNALTTAFNGIRVVDTTNLTAFSYVLRLDTTETLNGKTSTYIGALKLYDDADPTKELLKSEVTLYRGTNLIQRTVADGKRVWSYDPAQNAYSVDAYNSEQGANAVGYRSNYFGYLKQSIGGTPLNLITLLDQASLKGTAWVKDWIGGIRFEGQNWSKPKDPLNYIGGDVNGVEIIPHPHQFDTIWQKVPDNSRFVQFNLETFDAGSSWILNSIQIHRVDKVGAGTKVSDSYLTIPKDTNGLPMTESKNSPAFLFVPPNRSKVLASQRTIKF